MPRGAAAARGHVRDFSQLLLLLTLADPAASMFVGGPLEPGSGSQPPEGRPSHRVARNSLRGVLEPVGSLMTEMDAELLKLQSTPASTSMDETCQKFEVRVHQLLRNTERNLAILEEACQTPDGALKDPSRVMPLLSSFLDREAWLVNATMHSLLRSTREVIDLLPQNVANRTLPYLTTLGSLTDRLMGPVQEELQNLSAAAARPDPCGSETALGSTNRPPAVEVEATTAAGRQKVVVRSLADRVRSTLAEANASRIEAISRPRRGSSADDDADSDEGVAAILGGVQVSSRFMQLSEEVIVAGFGVMNTLQSAIRSATEDMQLSQDGCGGTEGAAEPDAKASVDETQRSSAATAFGGAWLHFLLLLAPAAAACAAAR